MLNTIVCAVVLLLLSSKAMFLMCFALVAAASYSNEIEGD
jgi:hypothetical protein